MQWAWQRSTTEPQSKWRSLYLINRTQGDSVKRLETRTGPGKRGRENHKSSQKSFCLSEYISKKKKIASLSPKYPTLHICIPWQRSGRGRRDERVRRRGREMCGHLRSVRHGPPGHSAGGLRAAHECGDGSEVSGVILGRLPHQIPPSPTSSLKDTRCSRRCWHRTSKSYAKMCPL